MTPVRNLVIFLCQGLRSDAVGDEHRWPLATPNLLHLAERGLRVVASPAAPSESAGMVSLLTGLHARQHGWMGADLPMPALHGAVPLWLKQAGYRVAGVGQVGAYESILDRAIVTRGVTETGHERCRYLAEAGAQGIGQAVTHQRRQARRHGPWSVDRLALEPDQDIDGYIAASAERMAGELEDDRPWALLVAFSGPSNDLPPPAMYADLLEPDSLASDFTPAAIAHLDTLADVAVSRTRLQNLTRAAVGRLRADYLGRVALIDQGIGRVMRAVNDRTDVDSTWSVVASDRGTLLGEHGLIGDRSFLAEAIETPLIVAGPPAGPAPRSRYLDALVSTIDIAPTIARLGQCEVPAGIAGRSLLEAFAGGRVPPPVGGNIAELPDRLMLETERHKLIVSMPAGEPIALYDLLRDSGERRNLFDAKQKHDILDPMLSRLGKALIPLRAAAF